MYDKASGPLTKIVEHSKPRDGTFTVKEVLRKPKEANFLAGFVVGFDSG